MGIFSFSQKETGAKCVSDTEGVSFVMYISGAEFEEHCFNISRDILDSVFYCSSGKIYDVITFLICIMHKRNQSQCNLCS